MNKKLYTFLTIFLLGFTAMQAQVVKNNEDDNQTTVEADDEEEEDEEEDGDTLDITDDTKKIKPEDIDMPEGMIQDIDDLMKEYHASLYLKPDANCNYRDENPSFDEDTYVSRLQRMPTVIEMPYNVVVRRYIDRYASQMRRTVSLMVGAQNFYMPFFEEALDAYGVPLELKYLPVIESALNPKAVSRVGATGLWQFMLVTGRQYGLKVNSLKDERCDPQKASYAAAHYLHDLYRIFGDWHLAIAAYNCGPGAVNKAIHRAGGVRDYWKIYPYLPHETRGYVPAFIAANYIMNYYCDHNICPMVTTLPAKTDTVVINRDVNLKQIAAVLGLDLEMLRAINPMYRHDIVNGSDGEGILRLPIDYVNKYIDNENKICEYNADELLKRSRVDVIDTPIYSYSTSHKQSSYSSYGRHHGKRDRYANGKNSKNKGKNANTRGKKDKKGAKDSKKGAKGRKSAAKSGGKAAKGKASKASSSKASKKPASKKPAKKGKKK